MQERITHVCKRMKDAGLVQLLVTDPAAIFYLTGKMIHPGERFLGLLLNTDGTHRLFVNILFPVPEELGVEKIRFSDTDAPMELVARYLDRDAVLGVDKVMASHFLLELMELHAAYGYVNGSPCVDDTRGCKSAEEQEKMIAASRLNDEAMARFRELVRPGLTEAEAARQVREIYRKLGAEDVSFDPIVSFGANAADPHHEPDGTVLKPGDCVLFDVGCRLDGYCSDMTRTFFYRRVSPEQRKVYETVLAANLGAEGIMTPGVRFCDLDGKARRIIAEAGYGDFFTHRLGHSIGTEVHEPGDVSAVNRGTATPGRIFSCEPGIYLPGQFGVRIEDLCLITETGVTVLNRYPKELDVIDPE